MRGGYGMAYLIGQYSVTKIIYSEYGKTQILHKTIPLRDLHLEQHKLEMLGYVFDEYLSQPEIERYGYSQNDEQGRLIFAYIEYEEVEVDEYEADY